MDGAEALNELLRRCIHHGLERATDVYRELEQLTRELKDGTQDGYVKVDTAGMSVRERLEAYDRAVAKALQDSEVMRRSKRHE